MLLLCVPDGVLVIRHIRNDQLANEQPDNERAQARVYALWTFAKAYVAEKDIVMLDGGKGADIRVRVYRCVAFQWMISIKTKIQLPDFGGKRFNDHYKSQGLD